MQENKTKISKRMYNKMVWCNNTISNVFRVSKEIEKYLENKGIDVSGLRQDDTGGYVDMVDYGRGNVPKAKLEKLFGEYKK